MVTTKRRMLRLSEFDVRKWNQRTNDFFNGFFVTFIAWLMLIITTGKNGITSIFLNLTFMFGLLYIVCFIVVMYNLSKLNYDVGIWFRMGTITKKHPYCDYTRCSHQGMVEEGKCPYDYCRIEEESK